MPFCVACIWQSDVLLSIERLLQTKRNKSTGRDLSPLPLCRLHLDRLRTVIRLHSATCHLKVVAAQVTIALFPLVNQTAFCDLSAQRLRPDSSQVWNSLPHLPGWLWQEGPGHYARVPHKACVPLALPRLMDHVGAQHVPRLQTDDRARIARSADLPSHPRARD